MLEYVRLAEECGFDRALASDHFSDDTDEESALEGASEQWRTNCVPGPVTQQLRTPAEFDELGEGVDERPVRENVRVSADID